MVACTRLIALLGALAVAFLASAGSALAASYSNTSRIAIADNQPASPYPSQIGVSGVSGEITDVNVTLLGLSHTCLDDVGVVVEAPGGQTLMLINSVGPVAGCPGALTGVNGVDLTVDDEAPAQFQDDLVPVSGAYRPANHQAAGTTLDSFDSPGPGSSYGNPGPALGGTATLAGVFDGADPSGTWKLWVFDFASPDPGEIAGGWRLEVTTSGGGEGDTTAPETQIDSGPSGTIAESTAEFSFSSNEPATFECSLDAAPFTRCASPQSYTGLSEGAHTFAVRATDSGGNTDPTPATRSFTVDFPDPAPAPPPADSPPAESPPPPSGEVADTEPPSVAITKLRVKRKKRKAIVSFTGSDNVSAASELTFTCKLDRKRARTCSSRTVLKKLKPGRHKIAVRASDAAGNESAAAVKRFRVKKPPAS